MVGIANSHLDRKLESNTKYECLSEYSALPFR